MPNRFLDRGLALLALGLLAGHLALSLPPGLAAAWRRLAALSERWNEAPATARRRVFGEEYAAAIEEIRRAVPAGASYLLVDGGREDQGAISRVRFDLAPRRPLWIGELDRLPTASRLRANLPGGPKQVVIAFPDGPPQRFDRPAFLRWLEERQSGR